MTEHSGTGPSLPRRRGKAQKSLDLIGAASAFLEDAHPTTVRGVCYHLFVHGVIPSMAKNETSRVSRLLTDARESGDLPWQWIVDETRELERTPQWDDPDQFIATVRRSYRRDFWAQQPARVEVWSEKGTVRGTLAPVLDEYGVGFKVMHGWASYTSVKRAAVQDTSQPLHALYVGDWDPSGLYMSDCDLPDRIERYSGHHVIVRRIALVAADLGDLPSFPAIDKKKDSRYRWFARHYGDSCWELDAMHPVTLRERVELAIQEHIEPEAWERCERAQQAEQETLRAVLDAWPKEAA